MWNLNVVAVSCEPGHSEYYIVWHRMLVAEADCCIDCGSVSRIFTVYTVVCNCPPTDNSVNCCGCGLNGCSWIPVSNVNFRNILCTYHHPLSALLWVVSP